jgi:hypothetical protein
MVTQEYSKEFEEWFWTVYPPRHGKKTGKYPSFMRWLKLTKKEPELMPVIRDNLRFQVDNDWLNARRKDGEYVPMPETWLNQRRFEDSIEALAQSIENASIAVSAPVEPPDDSSDAIIAERRAYFAATYPKENEAFRKYLARIEDEINVQSYNTWFAPLVCAGLRDGKVVVWAPRAWQTSWLEEHYRALMERIIGKPVTFISGGERV